MDGKPFVVHTGAFFRIETDKVAHRNKLKLDIGGVWGL